MIVVELSLRVSFTNAVSIIIESKEKKVIIIDRAVSTQRNYTSWVCKFPTINININIKIKIKEQNTTKSYHCILLHRQPVEFLLVQPKTDAAMD